MNKTHNTALLGTVVQYGNIKVTVEDICSSGRFVVKNNETPPQRFRGMVENGKFLHTPMDVDNFGDVSKITPKIQTAVQKENEIERFYAVETVCGGKETTAGGCGAPLGLVRTTKRYFEKLKGSMFFNFREHNDSEVDAEFLEARDNGSLVLKLTFRACFECRERY